MVSWFEWSKNIGLGVGSMEDLIIVSGCTLVTSWGAAVFPEHDLEAAISLADHALPNGGGRFVWGNINGAVPHHNSQLESVRSPVCVLSPWTDFSSYQKDNSSPMMNQCVFVRGFRAKRGFPGLKRIRAAAGPLPDDPENSPGDEMQVTGVPNDPDVGRPYVVR